MLVVTNLHKCFDCVAWELTSDFYNGRSAIVGKSKIKVFFKVFYAFAALFVDPSLRIVPNVNSASFVVGIVGTLTRF